MPHDKHRVLTELVSIVESAALKNLCDDHKKFLQKEVNRFVKEQNLIEAYGALMKLVDMDVIVEKAKKRISELRKETE